MKDKKYHRAFGVYGILVEGGKLLVIHKGAGPYKNRFDLPGGSLEEGETLIEALIREFKEETGLDIAVLENIGVVDFMFPSHWKEFTDVHHIAVFYAVKQIGGKLSTPLEFDGQDSLGTEWVTYENVSEENSSPLVVKAFEWILTEKLDYKSVIFDQWIIKTK